MSEEKIVTEVHATVEGAGKELPVFKGGIDLVIGPAGPGCSGIAVSDEQILQLLVPAMGQEKAQEQLPTFREMVKQAIIAKQSGKTEGVITL